MLPDVTNFLLARALVGVQSFASFPHTLMSSVKKAPSVDNGPANAFEKILMSRPVYEAQLSFWRTVISIFFREIRPRGAFNIPKEGPVIFVCAPHHNQACCHAVILFLDYGLRLVVPRSSSTVNQRAQGD